MRENEKKADSVIPEEEKSGLIMEIRYIDKDGRNPSGDFCYKVEFNGEDLNKNGIVSIVMNIIDQYEGDGLDRYAINDRAGFGCSFDGSEFHPEFYYVGEKKIDPRAVLDGIIRRTGSVSNVSIEAKGTIWILESVRKTIDKSEDLEAEWLTVKTVYQGEEVKEEYKGVRFFFPYRDSANMPEEYSKNELCSEMTTPFVLMLNGDRVDDDPEINASTLNCISLQKTKIYIGGRIVWLLHGYKKKDFLLGVEYDEKGEGYFYSYNDPERVIFDKSSSFRGLDEKYVSLKEMIFLQMIPWYIDIEADSRVYYYEFGDDESSGMDEASSEGRFVSDIVSANKGIGSVKITENDKGRAEAAGWKYMLTYLWPELKPADGWDINLRESLIEKNCCIIGLANNDRIDPVEYILELQNDEDRKKADIRSIKIQFKKWQYEFISEGGDTEDNMLRFNVCRRIERSAEGANPVKNIKEDDISAFSETDQKILNKCVTLKTLSDNIKELKQIRFLSMEQMVNKEKLSSGLDKEGYIDVFRKKLESVNEGENSYSISNDLLKEILPAFADWLPVVAKASENNESVSDLLEEHYLRECSDLLRLPWVCIMGEAGTGKTTLARRLAERCLGASFLETTGSDLLGAYVGHTTLRVAAKIDELQRMASKGHPAVLFIDEAYSLFESKGEFARDIIDTILPIATSETGLYIGGNTEKGIDPVFVNKNTVIWLGGYEDRLRKAFVTNEGLNSRFPYKIVIPDPKLSELSELFYDRLSNALNEDVKKEITAKYDDRVKEFLGWATSRSRSALFGNRRGINILVSYFKKYHGLGYSIEDSLSKAVEHIRNEISRQYSAELRKNIGIMPFEVLNEIELTLKDYAGNRQLKKELYEVADMMIRPKLYAERKIKMPKGALLEGRPGTGKTYLAKCFAGQIIKEIKETCTNAQEEPEDIAFIPLSAAQILSERDPVTVVKLLFSEASRYDSAVIFLDEIDAIGRDRNSGNSNTAVLTQLMIEMDGFGSRNNIFVLAATNDPDSLDEALKREGRFDRSFVVDIPDKESSKEIIDIYLKKQCGFCMYTDKSADGGDVRNDIIMLNEAQSRRILSLLGGRVPASVESIINETVILYHRTEEGLKDGKQKEDPVAFEHREKGDGCYVQTENYSARNTKISDIDAFLLDLKEVIDIKDMGRRKELREDIDGKINFSVNEGSSAIAVHEVGHAVTGLLLNSLDMERITILGRGDALGYVEHKRGGAGGLTKAGMLNRIKICMGGRVAEELIYGQDNASAGAFQDIKNATDLARNMVMTYGFSDMGFMSMAEQKGKYLGGGLVPHGSPGTLDLAEAEINRILKQCLNETRELLSGHTGLIRDLAAEVFDKKEITGSQMEEIYRKYMDNAE
ncbi:MAG: AAA family ATPase [Lachnospiraceae bacterium]|nr:AAA family ATPase [Lachnospiraceae bacterium]